MGFFLRGALVEYGSDFMGPLPNIVVFQFNPETISRTLNFPGSSSSTRAEGSERQREPAQVSAPPTESFPITLHFSAAEDLGGGGIGSVVPRVFGVGPQLAALEKMVFPQGGLLSGLVGAAVDAIGDALGGGDDEPSRPVPREQAPRILFIWGPSRVLPVRITSMSIAEQEYDALLNPVRAEVQIGLAIASFPQNSDDKLGQGALTYTNTVKDAQAVLNLAKAVELAIDVVLF